MALTLGLLALNPGGLAPPAIQLALNGPKGAERTKGHRAYKYIIKRELHAYFILLVPMALTLGPRFGTFCTYVRLLFYSCMSTNNLFYVCWSYCRYSHPFYGPSTLQQPARRSIDRARRHPIVTQPPGRGAAGHAATPYRIWRPKLTVATFCPSNFLILLPFFGVRVTLAASTKKAPTLVVAPGLFRW